MTALPARRPVYPPGDGPTLPAYLGSLRLPPPRAEDYAAGPMRNHPAIAVLDGQLSVCGSTILTRLRDIDAACTARGLLTQKCACSFAIDLAPTDFDDYEKVDQSVAALIALADFLDSPTNDNGDLSSLAIESAREAEGLKTAAINLWHIFCLRHDVAVGLIPAADALSEACALVSEPPPWSCDVDPKITEEVPIERPVALPRVPGELPPWRAEDGSLIEPLTEEAPPQIGLPPLTLVDPRSFAGVAVPARRWLVPGWAPWGQTSILYGDGGLGKSLLAQQLLTSAATGSAWLGMPVERVPALGVFCEDDDSELHRRQVDINNSLGISFDDLGDMRWLSRVSEDNAMMRFNQAGVGIRMPFWTQIRGAALAMGAKVVVLDGAADLFGGNEIVRGQVRQFIAMCCTALAREIDGVVLLLAHPSVAGMASERGDGGSTAWSNSVRSRWFLFRPKTSTGAPQDPDARVLANKKSNYSGLANDLALIWREGAFATPEQVTSVSGALAKASYANACEIAFIDALGKLTRQGVIVSARKGGANYAPKVLAKHPTLNLGKWARVDLERAMFEAMDRGSIVQIGYGKPSRGGMKLVLKASQEGAGCEH